MPNPLKLIEADIARQCRDFMRARSWRHVRTQFAFSPGSFSTGEPGMADSLFLRYMDNGAALATWVEFKSPNDKRRCNCGPGRQCKLCRQRAWQERERARGAVVWVVDDLQEFIERYEAAYGWLHRADTGRGQLDLLAGAK
jgi:hypothetical protein